MAIDEDRRERRLRRRCFWTRPWGHFYRSAEGAEDEWPRVLRVRQADARGRWRLMNQRRAIQRLAARGDLTIEMKLVPTVLRRFTVDYVTTTEYGADTPTWVVHLHRSCQMGDTRIERWFWQEFLGWRDVHVECVDLDGAIAQALEQSEPTYVILEERVWEHEDFKRACWLAEQFDVLQPVA